MARNTLHLKVSALVVSALVAGTAWAQTDDGPVNQPTDPAPVGVFADADGDGIANHADEDFARPEWSRGKGPAEFVDADGDGINDLAPDADGDGIANHLDEDYERPGIGRRGGRGARQFVDEDGDGINDLAPDHDGDGIANHLDEDYERSAMANGSGSSRGAGRGRRGAANGPGTFVDADGDGVNDAAPDTDGDGVINHLDDDYERPSAGNEQAAGTAKGRGQNRGGRGSGRR